MWRLVESMLRRLNRHRASSSERRLAREIDRLEAALEDARAEGEAKILAAEERARLAGAKAAAAEAERDAKDKVLKALTASNELIRALYEADTAEAARRIAGKGD